MSCKGLLPALLCSHCPEMAMQHCQEGGLPFTSVVLHLGALGRCFWMGEGQGSPMSGWDLSVEDLSPVEAQAA